MMVDIQVPASPDVGDIHVESLHPRGLSNPDRVSGAASLLAHVGVPHGHLCLHDPVDLLVVHIPFVPGIGEGEVSVSLQGFAEHATHNTDHQVNSEMDMEKKISVNTTSWMPDKRVWLPFCVFTCAVLWGSSLA